MNLVAGGASLSAFSQVAWSQTYPARPVRMVVGFPPGGRDDLIARLIGQWLSEQFGQPFVIENRPGATGNLAVEAVSRAAPDGHTLLLLSTSVAVNMTLSEKLDDNPIRDIAPVGGIIRVPSVMVVRPSFPAKTIPEFIAYAKANPGRINMASVGIGSVPHISGELFNMMAGIKMVHVPYRGAALAQTDLIGGHVQVMFVAISAAIDYIRNGQLRPLSVTAAKRLEALPNIPTVGEFLPGYEASVVNGIGAPKDTPAGIVNKINNEINAGLADPKLKARISELGGAVFVGSPSDFGKLIADETEKWAKVTRAANIKPE